MRLHTPSSNGRKRVLGHEGGGCCLDMIKSGLQYGVRRALPDRDALARSSTVFDFGFFKIHPHPRPHWLATAAVTNRDTTPLTAWLVTVDPAHAHDNNHDVARPCPRRLSARYSQARESSAPCHLRCVACRGHRTQAAISTLRNVTGSCVVEVEIVLARGCVVEPVSKPVE